MNKRFGIVTVQRRDHKNSEVCILQVLSHIFHTQNFIKLTNLLLTHTNSLHRTKGSIRLRVKVRKDNEQDPLLSIAVPESLYIQHHRSPMAFGKSISMFCFLFFVHILRTDSRSPRLLNGDLLPASQLWGFSLNHDFPSIHCFHNQEARIFTVRGGGSQARLTYVCCDARKEDRCAFSSLFFFSFFFPSWPFLSSRWQDQG